MPLDKLGPSVSRDQHKRRARTNRPPRLRATRSTRSSRWIRSKKLPRALSPKQIARAQNGRRFRSLVFAIIAPLAPRRRRVPAAEKYGDVRGEALDLRRRLRHAANREPATREPLVSRGHYADFEPSCEVLSRRAINMGRRIADGDDDDDGDVPRFRRRAAIFNPRVDATSRLYPRAEKSTARPATVKYTYLVKNKRIHLENSRMMTRERQERDVRVHLGLCLVRVFISRVWSVLFCVI